MVRTSRSAAWFGGMIFAAVNTTRDSHLPRYSAVILALVGTFFVLVPFFPDFPILALDPSWMYAMNEAVAKHLVFGRDVIFTFGPLSSIETHMYHPATDASALGFSIFLATAFFAACLALGRGSCLILALPLILSEIRPVDPFCFCLPLVFLLATARWTADDAETGKAAWILIAAVGVAAAVLPLVKASFDVSVAACGGLAIILAGRKSIAAAALLTVLPIAALVLFWRLTGQPLSQLPGYFLAQKPIIMGYGDAMSLPGPVIHVVAYLLGAALLLACLIIGVPARFGRGKIAMALGLAAVLFVGFKAGFVRHDFHACEAGSTLLLCSFILLLTFRSRIFAVGMIAGIAVWAVINSTYTGIDPASVGLRFAFSVAKSWEGVRDRIFDPGYFRARFGHARAESGTSYRCRQPMARSISIPTI